MKNKLTKIYLNKNLLPFLFLSLVLISFSAAAQQMKKNSIYIELGGNGILYSANYDRIIPISTHFKLAPRVGFEFIPRNKKDAPTYGKWSFPLELNILYSKKTESKNFFEGGIGLSLFNLVSNYKLNSNNEIIDTEVKTAKVTVLRLGFRHQKPEGGLMYRAGLLVKLSQDDYSKSRVGDDLFYKLWPGFSVGYSF
ncbi:hypothetical protein FA048_13460 [Pedobacter polaris]|uniref:DUF3575 domain-containing protein n=1 Tax=Pedobacter polaris TaxID=2571273 RepID=A0A4U1CR02_9SPHI|nr:hypothetical protein [Pedobacter polaris]TKC08162.1 hypothetical protein FA048_13460 [Pedobacter polaris]